MFTGDCCGSRTLYCCAKEDKILTDKRIGFKRSYPVIPDSQRDPSGGYGDTFVSIRDKNDYLVLDNGYIYLFVTRGIVLGALVLLVWWCLIDIAGKQKDVYLLLAVLMILVENCIDSSFLLYKAFPMYCVFVNYGLRRCNLADSNGLERIGRAGEVCVTEGR